MREPSISEYDKFAYPTAVYAQTHPDRLATISALMGLPAARIERARVLELGCGDGNNLITMACTLPDGTFQGIDLAIEPIRRGQETISALGLKNVTLRQMNILEAPADLGTFDYIIAHGLYSWVPEAVREKILEICRGHLAENGVAYVSFNAYPGNHLRDAVRRMMRFHVQQFSGPQEQIRQARAFLKFLAEAKTNSSHWHDLLKHQFERIEKYVDAGFFHDDLSPINQPFYFYEFMDAASRRGLQFLGEADFTDMQPPGSDVGDEAAAVLREMEQMGLTAREQYLDFVKGRSFRQTLLCRQEQSLDRNVKPECVFKLYAAADTVPVKLDADPAAPGPEDFRRGKSVIATGHPVFKSALIFLGRVWPRRVPFNELLEKARERVGRDKTTLDSDRGDLAEFLIRCYAIGFADLHSYASTFVTEISERPMASPLARQQIRKGPVVSSPRHLPLKIEDALGRDLLRLLDGTRDREALLKELGAGVKAGSTPIYSDGKPITEPQKAVELLAAQLEPSLVSLARLGLMVG
ncbi:MAG TPA: class I SAM-dependent methyltransferase [Verrucomicrobiae bacterium]|nr:class I SAM-dependent methyltransferase [Verrucomicrobiae bacterium]